MSTLSEPALRAIGKAALGTLAIVGVATLAPKWFQNPMSVAVLSGVFASVVGPLFGAEEPVLRATDRPLILRLAVMVLVLATVAILPFATSVAAHAPTLGAALAGVQFFAYAFRDEMTFRALAFSLAKKGAVPERAAFLFGVLAPVATVLGRGGSVETAMLHGSLGVMAGVVWMTGGRFWAATTVTVVWALVHDVIGGSVFEVTHAGRVSYAGASGPTAYFAAALLVGAAVLWFTKVPRPPKSKEMSHPTLWHNPRCSKSRKAAELLAETDGLVTRLYLDDPPSEDELRAVLVALGIPAKQLVRKKDAINAELEVDDTSEEELIAAMSDNPRLIERPILVVGNRAVIGRPPEQVLSLLTQTSSKG